MSPMLTIERRPLPVAPRPFEAEVLGGWIGRLAARYRMTVPEFAARHELDFQIEDGGGWLTMSPLRSQSVDVLGALTRISRERIMAIHVPLPLTSKRTHFCYCARCVFLNPLDVAGPIWRWECLDPNLSACPSTAWGKRELERQSGWPPSSTRYLLRQECRRRWHKRRRCRSRGLQGCLRCRVSESAG